MLQRQLYHLIYNPSVPLGNAVNIINEVVGSMALPVSIQGSFRGIAQAFQDSLKNEPYLIMAALITVYIVLGMLYESLIHPLTIISTLPSAGVGALIPLLITRTELNVIALIGIILLIGIVKKNAIMMVDFIIELRKDNKILPKEAVYQAANLRFRPIMMTIMVALLEAIPMVLGKGYGSEMQRHSIRYCYHWWAYC
ncbi:MAG: efflux RND transporter permease subunit [Candidatus Rickettsia vulgarisii]